MTTKRAAALLLASTLTACATTAPRPAPPPLFQGSATLTTIEGTASTVKQGEVRKGEAFAISNMEHTRTATLQQPLTLKTFFSSTPIPAGQKFYGMTMRKQYGGSQMTWCTVADSKLLGANIGDEAACFAWFDGKQAAVYRGGPYASPYFTGSFVGAPDYGPIPDLVEENVDWGREFKVHAVFRDVDRKDMDIDLKFDDGSGKMQVVRTLEPRRDEAGVATVSFWGGTWELTPVDADDDTRVMVKEITPPTGKSLDAGELMDLLLEMIEQRKKAEEAAESGQTET